MVSVLADFFISLFENILSCGNENPAICVCAWALMSISNFLELRQIIFEMLVCSLNGKCSTCMKNAKSISKQQTVMSRISLSYIGEYLRKEYRTPYKVYMVLYAAYSVWLIGNVLWIATLLIGVYNDESTLMGVICSVSFVIWVLLLLPISRGRNSRRLERRFPNIR